MESTSSITYLLLSKEAYCLGHLQALSTTGDACSSGHLQGCWKTCLLTSYPYRPHKPETKHEPQNLPREINRLVPERLTANPAGSTGGRGGHKSWLGAKLLGGGGDLKGLHIMHHCWVKVGMGPEFHASGAWQTVETRAVTIHWPTPNPLHSRATLFLAKLSASLSLSKLSASLSNLSASLSVTNLCSASLSLSKGD